MKTGYKSTKKEANRHSNKTKRNILIVSAIAVPVVIAIVVYAIITSGYESLVAASINGVPLTNEEISVKLQDFKASVYAEFNDKYGMDYSKEDWFKSYEGQIPIEIARQRALDYFVRIKTVQKHALDMGIIEGTGYDEFLAAFSKENEERLAKISQKIPVYGPEQYDITTYYSIYNNGIERELITALSAKEGWEPNQDELLDFYNEVRDDMFAEEYLIELEKIIVKYTQSDRDDALALAIELRSHVMAGEDIKEFVKNKNNVIYTEKYTLDSKQKNFLKEHNPELLDEYMKLGINSVSEVIENESSFIIAKCISIEDKVYKDYKEYENVIREEYIYEKYQDYIKELIESAVVEINNFAYGRLF